MNYLIRNRSEVFQLYLEEVEHLYPMQDEDCVLNYVWDYRDVLYYRKDAIEWYEKKYAEKIVHILYGDEQWYIRDDEDNYYKLNVNEVWSFEQNTCLLNSPIEDINLENWANNNPFVGEVVKPDERVLETYFYCERK